MAIETTSDLSLVGTSQIVDGSVTSAKIAAGAVGTAAISSGAATSGQILQANGSGAVSFATPASGGGMTLIATATPSAATSLSFTSIPGTYKHLQLIWFDVYQSVGGVYWTIRINNDSATNYYWRREGVNTSVSATSIGNTNQFAPVANTTTSSTAYNSQAKGVFDIYRYTENSSKFFAVQSASDATDPLFMALGVYLGTSSITQIDFIRSSTQTITGKFYLYGVS